MFVFVHTQGIKTVHAWGAGSNSVHVVVECPTPYMVSRKNQSILLQGRRNHWCNRYKYILSCKEIKHVHLKELVLIDAPLDFPTFHWSFLMVSRKVETRQ